MTAPASTGVVVDTMVFSWLIDPTPPSILQTYTSLIGTSPVVLALQTAAELRFGALNRGWGQIRTVRLERSITDAGGAVRPDDQTATRYAELKDACRRIGHGLAHKDHDGDRWIAATAVRLGIPLVSDDQIFRNVPGLTLLTA